ncbi:hypothetical protein [Thiocystis violacea]|uniref:DUF7931 domain-containing protein n=1 Tax=Thiocystis violacea TaxID=13725 RepID=UPI0019088F3B|nr:hypothetical protein [Thiocystis violacea]MBK1718668.1 hypothetical protein [Thiocystis violacea]
MPEYDHREQPTLGHTKGLITLEGRKDIAEASADMAEQAARELLILSPSLEPALYDREPFPRAVRRLALARANLPVRVLVLDPRAASQTGHRLIELARRLTSRIAIQRLDEDDQARPDAFLVADGRGYIHRRLAANMEAVASFNDPLEARRLRGEFERLWERSRVDSELRRLFI